MTRRRRSRRVTAAWSLLLALAALIVAIEGTSLFSAAPPERTGRVPVFGFTEPDLGAVEVVWQGRTASIVRDPSGLWLRREHGHGHADEHRHTDGAGHAHGTGGARGHHHTDGTGDADGHRHSDGTGDAHGHRHADGTGDADGHPHTDGTGDAHGHRHTDGTGDAHGHRHADGVGHGDTHGHEAGHRHDGAAGGGHAGVPEPRADPAASREIAETLAAAARMLADRRIGVERGLDAYGLAKPPIMVAFYPRGEDGPDYARPLDVLYVGDLLTTEYTYYALRDGDREISLIPRYQIALLLALAFGEENAPSPLPARAAGAPG